MSSSVTWQDSGLEAFKEQLAELKKMKVGVGFQPPEGRQKYPSGITVAKLAAVMEFGGDELPERSFIRSTIHENRDRIAAYEDEQIGRALSGELTNVQAMSNIAKFVHGLIKKKLQSAASWAAPLDPETIERKGGATPLQETTLLLQSLSWRVSIGRKELARGS